MIREKQIMINLAMQPSKEDEDKDLETLIFGSSFSDIFEDFFGDDIFSGGKKDQGEGLLIEVMI